MTTALIAETVPPPMADQARKGAWYTLWVILGLTLFAFVDRQVLILAAAPMAKELGLSDAQLGLVQGLAFSVFTVLAVYPIAWAADRFDRRIVAGLCVVVWSIGTAACGLAQDFTQLFLAAVAIAAGEAGLAPIVLAAVPDLFTGKKRVMANAFYYFFAYVGVSVGLAIGGIAISALDAAHPTLPAVLQQFSAWRLAFFMVSLPAPVVLVFLAFATLRRPPAAAAAKPAGPPSGDLLAFLCRHWKPVSLVYGAIAFYLLAFGGYLAWLPVASTRLFAATAAQNGLGMGLAVVLGMVGGVTIGTVLLRRLLGRLGQAASIRVGWTICAAGTPILFAFPFITAAWQGYALFGLLMLVGTAMGSLVPNILQAMAPAKLRARVLAIYTIAAGLVGGSAPTIVGWVSGGLGGPRGLLFAMTLVALPSWILAGFLFWRSERPFGALAAEVQEADARA